MAIELICVAWRVKCNPTQKFILIALADNGDDETWKAWPSLTNISNKTGFSRSTIKKTLRELETAGYLSRSGGSRTSTTTYYLHIDRWADIDPRPRNTLGREMTGGGPTDDPEVGRQSATEPSGEPSVNRSRSRSTQGTQIPEDFSLTPDRLKFALSKGLTQPEAEEELEKFIDHWRGVPGQKGRKSDWDATWRNWVRNALKFRQPPKHNGHQREEDPFDGCINRDRWEGPQ